MSRVHWWLFGLVALLLFLSLASVMIGTVSISMTTVLDSFHRPESVPDSVETILWRIRLPRTLLAITVGWALGVAGAAFQGLFRNPLAEPFVIGASSGAALGATIVIVFVSNSLLFVSPAALLGALLTVLCVMAISRLGRTMPMVSLLLAGVAISSFLSAIVTLLMFLHNQHLIGIFAWLTGTLNGRPSTYLYGLAPLTVLASLGIWVNSDRLDGYTLGDETASSLGIHLGKLRIVVILWASLATGCAVAAAGVVGFVGLVAPHVARWLVGARHQIVIPVSGLLGASGLLLSDLLARTLAAPRELPLGVVTALVGSPFFIYILMRPPGSGMREEI